MKKIFVALISISMLISSTVFAAGELASITVSSKKSSVPTQTFVTGAGKTEEISISDIMSELENVTATKEVLQPLKIKTTVAPVDFWLKLELSDTAGYNKADSYTAIDYYMLKITDENDRVIYEDSGDDKGKTSKYIHIGENTSRKKENTYNIYISANKAINTSELTSKASDINWSVVYTDDEKQFNSATQATNPPAITVTSAPTSAPATASNTPSNTPSVKPTETASNGEKKIEITVTANQTGKNILKPGKYRMIGIGNVTLFDKDGEVKTKGKLINDENGGLIVTVAEGEKLLVEGGSDAFVQFKSASASSSTAQPSASAKTSAKPSASAKATEKATASAAAKTSAKPSEAPKSNPKTGDYAPIAGLCALAFISLGTAVYIIAGSRKKHN